jgi:hypothetical protein
MKQRNINAVNTHKDERERTKQEINKIQKERDKKQAMKEGTKGGIA